MGFEVADQSSARPHLEALRDESAPGWTWRWQHPNDVFEGRFESSDPKIYVWVGWDGDTCTHASAQFGVTREEDLYVGFDDHRLPDEPPDAAAVVVEKLQHVAKKRTETAESAKF